MPTRTITLTDHPPVEIDEDVWTEIASAKDCDDRRVPSQANRRGWIKVRRHADGRHLVYGGSSSSFQGERDHRAGHLVPSGLYPSEVVERIRTVAEAVGWPDIAADCIADLPPERLG